MYIRLFTVQSTYNRNNNDNKTKYDNYLKIIEKGMTGNVMVIITRARIVIVLMMITLIMIMTTASTVITIMHAKILE